MYKRLYSFRNNNNVVFNLQFGFGQQQSTSHALIDITEDIKKALGDGNISCEGLSFVDLQEAFDNVNQQILLAKLNRYEIGGVSNDWFKSYLSNRNKFVVINRYEPGLAPIN